MTVKIKRVYEPADREDGYRILVDRLWPRGVARENAVMDEWLKEVAPSTELRKSFNHDIKQWGSFKKQYIEELKTSSTFLQLLDILATHKIITLLYSAKDELHNQAVVLKSLLDIKTKQS